MPKVPVTTLANLQNETSAVTSINVNFAAISAALDDVLYRASALANSENEMEADLDMNAQRIINLPLPVDDLEPVRKVDLGTWLADAEAAAVAAEAAQVAAELAETNAETAETNAEATLADFQLHWRGVLAVEPTITPGAGETHEDFEGHLFFNSTTSEFNVYWVRTVLVGIDEVLVGADTVVVAQWESLPKSTLADLLDVTITNPLNGDLLQWSGNDWVNTALADLGVPAKATDAQVRAATTGDTYIAPELIESASAYVALTDGANIALNWDTGLNFNVTLAGNRTIDNPTNGQAGTWRTIIVTQDATGSRTLAFGNQYKFAGGAAPTLTTDPNAIDVLSILCIDTINFLVFSSLDFS